MWKIIHNFTKLEKILVIFLAVVIIFTSSNLVWSFYIDNTEVLPADGGVFAEGAVGEVRIINPVFANLNPIDADLTSLIFSGLMKYNSKTNDFEDDIAEHSLSFDKRTYTFILKDNIYFHDGEKLTADDVLFTYKEVIQNPNFKNELLRREFEGIEIEKIDNQKITFTLPTPYKFFLTNLTIGILPKHLLFDLPIESFEQSTFNLNPIGSGPYKFEQIISNTNSIDVILKKFDDYYASLPYINGLVIKVYHDYGSLVKDLDVLNGVRSVPKDQITNFPKQNRFNVIDYHLPQYVALFLNTSSPILADKRVRLALQLATNRPNIISDLNEDLVIDTPLMEVQDQNWVFQFDQEKAAGSLFDAGWNLPNKASTEPLKPTENKPEVKPQALNSSNRFLNLFIPQVQAAVLKYINFPNRGNDFETSEDPIFITGTVPEGTQSVSVNNYILKKFEPGNKTWSYKAGTEIRTMHLGENLYELYVTDANGSKSKIDQIKITLLPKKEVAVNTGVTVVEKPKSEEVKVEEKKVETILETEKKAADEKKIETGAIISEDNKKDEIVPEVPKKNISNLRVNNVGNPLELNLITSSKPEFYQDLANDLKKQWAEVGVGLKIEILEGDEFQTRVRERKYDILLYGQSLGYNLDAYPYWHSSQVGEKGLNLSNYASFEADSLMEEIRSTHNESRRKAALEKLGKVISQDMPVIMLYQPIYYLVFDKKVNNVNIKDLPNMSDRFSNINEWYLKEDRFFAENKSWGSFWLWLIKNSWGIGS